MHSHEAFVYLTMCILFFISSKLIIIQFTASHYTLILSFAIFRRQKYVFISLWIKYSIFFSLLMHTHTRMSVVGGANSLHHPSQRRQRQAFVDRFEQ